MGRAAGRGPISTTAGRYREVDVGRQRVAVTDGIDQRGVAGDHPVAFQARYARVDAGPRDVDQVGEPATSLPTSGSGETLASSARPPPTGPRQPSASTPRTAPGQDQVIKVVASSFSSAIDAFQANWARTQQGLTELSTAARQLASACSLYAAEIDKLRTHLEHLEHLEHLAKIAGGVAVDAEVQTFFTVGISDAAGANRRRRHRDRGSSRRGGDDSRALP